MPAKAAPQQGSGLRHSLCAHGWAVVSGSLLTAKLQMHAMALVSSGAQRPSWLTIVQQEIEWGLFRYTLGGRQRGMSASTSLTYHPGHVRGREYSLMEIYGYFA